ncbi:MAG: helix-turn-helix transcriptional regulator [Deltaproteobacteria bacterium]|nr:helix-turn-helix transcriptional regulator [Myxococcales bacterium]MDP3219672.1 helix-turn-helix transcriptional regulator [Deltaproteobacteria bacterium]
MTTARGTGGIEGARVRERRLALGLTQADLATRSGLSQEAISRLENGRIRGLMQPTQDALAGALGVSVEWLRGGDDDAPGEPAPARPAATATEALDEAAEDPLMRAASQAFDPRRHHLLVDANRVLALLNAVELRLLGAGELAEVARQWLDGASALRREGVAVTAENLLWKVTAARR